MAQQMLIRSPLVNRGQPLLTNKPSIGEEEKKKKKGRCAEVAGGTAADCAAICCCCPCGLMNLLILAVYKVPAELWKKRKRGKMKKKKKKKELLQQQRNTGKPSCCCDESTVDMAEGVAEKVEAGDGTAAAADLEKEMWSRFYGAGFWRSVSRREES